MNERIVILDAFTLNPGDLSWDPLLQVGSLTVYEHTAEHEVIERIKDATLVLTNDTPLSSEAIRCASELRYIGVMSTGYDAVDVEAAHERNIVVTNIPAYSTWSVAQMTFALLLELCHHAGHHDAQVHQGRWSASRDFCFCDYPGIELHGKTFGIVGYGPIGETVAQIARAFGMKVLVYTRNAHLRDSDEDIKFVPLTQLFASSDIISFHVPAKRETVNMVNKKTISLMKPSVILINTARGALFDEEAVTEALINGDIGAVATDVMRHEPPHTSDVLLDAPHCIITPHIAWATTEARTRCVEIACNNVISFLNGHTVHTVKS